MKKVERKENLEINAEERQILEAGIDTLIQGISGNLNQLKPEDKMEARNSIKKCLALNEKIGNIII